MLLKLPTIPSKISQNFYSFLNHSHIITYYSSNFYCVNDNNFHNAYCEYYSYWRTKCLQWRFSSESALLPLCPLSLSYNIILEITSLHLAIITPDYSLCLSVSYIKITTYYSQNYAGILGSSLILTPCINRPRFLTGP